MINLTIYNIHLILIFLVFICTNIISCSTDENVGVSNSDNQNEVKILDESVKKEIWKKVLEIEKQSKKEALETYPDISSKPLQKGEKFTLTKQTPLMPKVNLSDTEQVRNNILFLDPGFLIYVNKESENNGIKWFLVEAFDNNGVSLGNVWINSIALIGQGSSDDIKAIWVKQNEMTSDLIRSYKEKLIEEYKITKEELVKIENEGFDGGW